MSRAGIKWKQVKEKERARLSWRSVLLLYAQDTMGRAELSEGHGDIPDDGCRARGTRSSGTSSDNSMSLNAGLTDDRS